MPQGIQGWAIWALAQAGFTLAYKLAYKLAENAMIGWGDEKIAARFGITSPDASTVFDWAIPFILAAVTLWIFHRFTAHPLKQALAKQSNGGDRFSATGMVYGPSPRTWIQKVEPYHIIILGLAVAGAGVIWLTLKGADPRIAQLQAQVLVLQQHAKTADIRTTQPRSPITLPLAQEPPTIPSVIYTERDIRELLDALADANDLVEKRFSPAIYTVTNATANWRGAIPNVGVQGFAANLALMREGLQENVWRPLNQFVYETHAGYKDQLRAALALDHEAARGELTRSLQVAIEAVERLPDNPSQKTMELVAPQFAEAYKQAEFLYNWLTEARGRISGMRDNLRTKGRTGYEKG